VPDALATHFSMLTVLPGFTEAIGVGEIGLVRNVMDLVGKTDARDWPGIRVATSSPDPRP